MISLSRLSFFFFLSRLCFFKSRMHFLCPGTGKGTLQCLGFSISTQGALEEVATIVLPARALFRVAGIRLHLGKTKVWHTMGENAWQPSGAQRQPGATFWGHKIFWGGCKRFFFFGYKILFFGKEKFG